MEERKKKKEKKKKKSHEIGKTVFLGEWQVYLTLHTKERQEECVAAIFQQRISLSWKLTLKMLELRPSIRKVIPSMQAYIYLWLYTERNLENKTAETLHNSWNDDDF